jgi:glutathione S-transferase
LMLDSEEEKAKLSQEFVDTVGKEIEPLLKDAKPFFGGSDKITLAEVRFFFFQPRKRIIY